MQLHRPDPNYVSSKKARRNFVSALELSLAIVGVVWFIFITDAYLGLELARYGLRPRSTEGLVGVLSAPFLHGSAEHMFTNTAPLIISLCAILYLYPNSALRVIPMVWLGSGLLAWFIGRPSVHIGASGFIYGLLAFIAISGLLRQDLRSVAVSLLVWFLYGSMIWGVLPIRPQMSWELHLAGAVLGVAMAVLYRNWDRVPLKRYSWEEDDTVPDWFPESDGGKHSEPDRHGPS